MLTGNTPDLGNIFEELLDIGKEFDNRFTLADRQMAEVKAEKFID